MLIMEEYWKTSELHDALESAESGSYLPSEMDLVIG